MDDLLDPRDRRLLALLQANARLPLAALARAIGLSRSATQDRLRKLERRGVIQGYHARVAEDGERGVSAWLTLRLQPGKRCVDVVPALLAMDGMVACYSIAGPDDLLARARLDTLEALAALREAVACHPAVASVATATVLKVHLPG